MSRLVAEGLTKRYGGRVPVRGVSLRVEEGEVLGLIGPNGGGKSTLLLMLAGLILPDEGSVRLDGRPVGEVVTSGAVGLIATEAGLYPLLTGRENLRYFGGLHGLSPARVDQVTAALLRSLSVDVDLDRPAGTYSAGMRQKISLARALMLDPRLLLLDEPTANLDPLAAHTIHQAVRVQADRGVAVVLCTHDLHAVEHSCDRVVVMNGELVSEQRLESDPHPPPASRLLPLYRAGELAPTGEPTRVPASDHAPRPLFHVAAREIREQARQPWMLAVVAALFAVVSGLCLGALWLLDALAADPAMLATVAGPAFAVDPLREAVVTLLGFLGFSQFMGVSAVLAGHALLHERQCATLTFLLLAPVDRLVLLLAKVLGALAWPTLFYVVFVGGASALACTTGAAEVVPERLPLRTGWWAGALVAAPAWSFASSSACVLIGAVSRDVRAAQQGVWFLVFFATLGAGTLLSSVTSTPGQLALAASAASLGGILLWSGSVLLHRDLGR